MKFSQYTKFDEDFNLIEYSETTKGNIKKLCRYNQQGQLIYLQMDDENLTIKRNLDLNADLIQATGNRHNLKVISKAVTSKGHWVDLLRETSKYGNFLSANSIFYTRTIFPDGSHYYKFIPEANIPFQWPITPPIIDEFTWNPF